MLYSLNGSKPTTSNIHVLLGYVADLELEVDRLRKQGQFTQYEVRGTLKRIQLLCADASPVSPEGTRASNLPTPLGEIDQAVKHLAAVLRDLQEPSGYHPAHDQVIAVAVRPLIEQVFRFHQRVLGAANVELRLELATDHVDWFPARLRHILDNLVCNSLRYRDSGKSDAWVRVAVRASAEAYEFTISDNGLGLPAAEEQRMFELFSRAAPARAAGLGVGLPVVKLLVEQSEGTLTVTSGQGQGTTFVVTLPRYDVDDYLT